MNIWLAEIWRAWRASVRRPGFLLLASGVLALGIGASAGAFVLVENMLLKPLPFAQPQQIIALQPSYGPHAFGYISPQQYEQMQPLAGVASSGLIFRGTQLVVLGGAGKSILAHQTWVSRGLLRTLGKHMALGRSFNPQDYASHGPAAVLLSHGFWLRRYGGNPEVIGQSIQVAGSAHTVVGLLATSFRTLNTADIVRPMASDALAKNGNGLYIALARLDGRRAAGAVAAQATAQLRAATQKQASNAAALPPPTIAAQSARLLLRDTGTGVVLLLQACGLLVLLVATVNLVNLIVMRAATSAHALAVRGSLGATGLRLALPVLAEGLLIGLLGGVVGVVIGWTGIGLLQHVVAPAWLGHASLPMDGWVWLLAIGVGVAVSVLAAWLGQRFAWRRGSMEELREGARSGAGLRAGRLGRALVVVQVALVTVVLMATAMLGHAVVSMSGQPIGFDATHVLVFKTKPPAAQYATSEATRVLAKRLQARLRAIPGVDDATIASHLPIGLTHASRAFVQADGSSVIAQSRGVDGAYFRAFSIPLIAGRGFSSAEVVNGARVAVVNRQLALKKFHGKAVGQSLGSGQRAFHIIGVVGDVGTFGSHAQNQVYVPGSQYYDPAFWSVAMRVHGAPDTYRDAVYAAVRQVAPLLPIADMRSMQQAVDDATRSSRSSLLLVGLLAALALLLAAAGQYAVTMAAVVARERELGIRMALGASPARLTRWVMATGMRRIVLGLVIGVAIGIAVSLLLRRLFVLLGRSPIDPWAIGVTCVVLAIAGLLACLLPALRAARVQPMHALRGE